MDPANATMKEVLDFLRNERGDELQRLMRDEYVLWIGSGISRARFPNLQDLLYNLLVRLFERRNPSNPTSCPYSATLARIRQLTTLNEIDMTVHPNDWPGRHRVDFLRQLVDKYADVLDETVRVPGSPLSVCWDILELDRIYSDPSVEPDAEHRLLALLIEEGAITELVTTNWDALIEKAHLACRSGRAATLKAVACSGELDGCTGGSCVHLLKIHGCAYKCSQDSDCYRPFIVATRSHITAWTTDQKFACWREVLRTLLRQRPALFVGISGQDWNLQVQCLGASLNRESWPIAPPRVCFAEPAVGLHQRAVLKLFYGEELYQQNGDAIDAQAALRFYAKPLLGSIYILTLLEKAKLLLHKAEEELSSEQLRLVKDWLNWCEQALCDKYDVISDPDQRWRLFADEVPYQVARFTSLYREQKVPAARQAYQPLWQGNLAQMTDNPNIAGLWYHWLLYALALFHKGSEQGNWVLKWAAGHRGEFGQFTLDVGGAGIRLFVLNQSQVGLDRLEHEGFMSPSNPSRVVILYPHGPEPKRHARSPARSSLPGRSHHPLYHEIWLEDLISDAATLHDSLALLENELKATALP